MRMLWALVYLIGLIATHYLIGNGTLSVMWATWIWFVLLIISSYSVGKSYGKMPAAQNQAWMGINGLFIVLVLTMLLGFWSGGPAVMFALYFLLIGGGMFGAGHDMKVGTWLGAGLTWVALGIVFPSWFGATPFLAAALFLGVPMLLMSWKMK